MAWCWWGRGPHNHIYPGKAHRDDMSAMQNGATWHLHQLWTTSFHMFHTLKAYSESDLLCGWGVYVFHCWNIFIQHVWPSGDLDERKSFVGGKTDTENSVNYTSMSYRKWITGAVVGIEEASGTVFGQITGWKELVSEYNTCGRANETGKKINDMCHDMCVSTDTQKINIIKFAVS